jgi:2-polyprenyl-3-methyl-5-hydroxy-6-metoxy-1,4-benzoquinol methylase
MRIEEESGAGAASHRRIRLAAIAVPWRSRLVCKDLITDLYERHALAYDRDRDRSLQERAWLDRFLIRVPPGETILDVGCGMGEPIARYLIERGLRVVGMDASRRMIERCRSRFPDAEWLVAGMRALELHRRFDGILAWDSLFHLSADDQRGMFRRFAGHARPGAPSMFTSGSAEGESVGVQYGESLYHASLAPAEYRTLLADSGFTVREFVAEDPECGGHTAWLATYEA